MALAFSRISLAYDGSAASRMALEHAAPAVTIRESPLSVLVVPARRPIEFADTAQRS